MDILKFSVTEIVEAAKSGKASCEEITKAFCTRIDEANPKINAVIDTAPQVLEQAKELDKKRAQGEANGKLFGLPIAVKDMFCVTGYKASAASKALSEFSPPYTATVVQNLLDEGAIVLARCNQDEFAMGSSNENSFYGPCKNPWNPDYVPGGSSGGSAATVASRMAPVSLGTDTGGSIRQPASFCGLVGVKPTYGRSSRFGVVAFASSLDQAGPMCHRVKDCAQILEVMCGHDSKDSTSSSEEVPIWSEQLTQDIEGMKIGFPLSHQLERVNENVKLAVQSCKEFVERAGAEIVEVELPYLDQAIAIYYLISASEASSNLSRYDGVRYGFRSDFSNQKAEDLEEFYSRTRGEAFGDEVKRRILLGTFCLSSGYYDAYYKKASRVRRLMRDGFKDLFGKVDALISPVTPGAAFRRADTLVEPVEMYKTDEFTTSANLAGIPALSLPISLNQQHLPIGIQVSSWQFNEQAMFNVALALEKACGDWKGGQDVLV